jgi:predicted DNA-binding protein with PD1-like motif
MRSQVLSTEHGQQSWILVFQLGDEVMSTLKNFAHEKQLAGAHFKAIGAFQRATLGYFDWSKKDYEEIPVEEQVEVVSLLGDIATGEKGQPKVHAHVVLGRRTGAALAGHLLSAHVRPTLELVLTETPAHLRRQHDPETGLALIVPNAS